MQNLTTITTADKLKSSRDRLQHLTRDVRMSEGRLLDFAAAEHITRVLISTARDLEEARMSVAVMERRLAGVSAS